MRQWQWLHLGSSVGLFAQSLCSSSFLNPWEIRQTACVQCRYCISSTVSPYLSKNHEIKEALNSQIISGQDIILIVGIHQRATLLNQDARPIHVGLASLLYFPATEMSPETTNMTVFIESMSNLSGCLSHLRIIWRNLRRHAVSHWLEQYNTLNQQSLRGKGVNCRVRGSQRSDSIFTKYAI